MEDSSKSVGWWCNPLRIKYMRFTWSLIWSFFCITYLYIWSWWSKTTSDRGCYRHIVTQAKPFDDKFTGLRDTRGKYVVSSRSYLTHEDYKQPNISYRLVASWRSSAMHYSVFVAMLVSTNLLRCQSYTSTMYSTNNNVHSTTLDNDKFNCKHILQTSKLLAQLFLIVITSYVMYIIICALLSSTMTKSPIDFLRKPLLRRWATNDSTLNF